VILGTLTEIILQLKGVLTNEFINLADWLEMIFELTGDPLDCSETNSVIASSLFIFSVTLKNYFIN